MCCLRYEHEFYVQQRKRFPKEGKLIRTSRGEEKVVANDIFRERVTLRGNDGEVRLLPLDELRAEMGANGLIPLGASRMEEPEPIDSRSDVEEDIELVTTAETIVADEPASSATATTVLPAAPAGGSPVAEAARKPHRRRGRRGGRRNRAGRERGDGGEGGDDNGGPPSSEN
jgi:hypothetical protein